MTGAGRQKLAFVSTDAGMAPTRKSQNNAKALLSYSTFACAQVVGFEVIRLYGYSEITIIHLN